MATEIWVNIGSGNGLLPDGTKPLPEPLLTDHQWSPETFILGQFHKGYLSHQSLTPNWKLHLKFHWNLPGANESIWPWQNKAQPNCVHTAHIHFLLTWCSTNPATLHLWMPSNNNTRASVGHVHCVIYIYISINGLAHKTVVTPLLMQWSYCSLVLSHWHDLWKCSIRNQDPCKYKDI